MRLQHFYSFNDGRHHIQYSLSCTPSNNQTTLIFLHGIGDSSDNYLQFLNDPELQNYNIIIPDMLGYGQSKCEKTYNDYLFKSNLKIFCIHLLELCQEKKIDLGNVIVIGHSMGGDFGALLCDADTYLKDKIVGFINIEGSLTENDTYISKPAYNAVINKNFAAWFQEYNEKIAPTFQNSGNYLSSLAICNPAAFMQNTVELFQNCLDAGKDSQCKAKNFTHLICNIYNNLTIPKMFIYGNTTSLQTQNFVQNNKWLNGVFFKTDSHWIMLSCYQEFKTTLQGFIKNINSAKVAKESIALLGASISAGINPSQTSNNNNETPEKQESNGFII